MSERSNNHQPVWVVTIRDLSPEGTLGFDIKDIILSLLPGVQSFTWLVLEDDLWVVPEDLPIPTNQLLGTHQLRALFENVLQTIDGTVVGGLAPEFGIATCPGPGDLEAFIDSTAQVMIRGVDSSFFEVMTKNPEHIRALKRTFLAVREEDLSSYLGVPAPRLSSPDEG